MALSDKKKICFVVGAELSARVFLLNHIDSISKVCNVTLLVNTQNPDFLSQLGINARVVPLNISRTINLLSDLKCLQTLIKTFTNERFDAIHSVTPKAGLLAMLAGFLCRIPFRTHTFTGQVWANKTGIRRLLLKNIDRLMAALATHRIVDSPSQRDFLLAEKVLPSSNVFVFGHGSIAGVDSHKFKPDGSARQKIRSTMKLGDNFVFLFLGRLNKDKGVLDLAQAFIASRLSNATLLFVGPDEQSMQMHIQQLPGYDTAKIRFVDYTDTPQRYMVAADALCLPSYREGFGSVIIEAASCGIPTVASRIYGITDAVIDQQTGLLHQAGNVSEITSTLTKIASDATLYRTLADNAYQHALSNFDSKMITQAWCDFYKEIFANVD